MITKRRLLTAGGSAKSARRYDRDGLNVYAGVAPEGTDEDAAGWRITRLTLSETGGLAATATATDVAWDDRLTEVYS